MACTAVAEPLALIITEFMHILYTYRFATSAQHYGYHKLETLLIEPWRGIYGF